MNIYQARWHDQGLKKVYFSAVTRCQIHTHFVGFKDKKRLFLENFALPRFVLHVMKLTLVMKAVFISISSFDKRAHLTFSNNYKRGVYRQNRLTQPKYVKLFG